MLQVAKLSDQATIPTRATVKSAGYDLYSAIETSVPDQADSGESQGAGDQDGEQRLGDEEEREQRCEDHDELHDIPGREQPPGCKHDQTAGISQEAPGETGLFSQ